MNKALVVFALLLCPLALHSQEAASVAMPFSVVPRNVRTLSMGGITSADAAACRMSGDKLLDFNFSWYKFAPKGTGSDDLNLDAFVKVSKKIAISAQLGLDVAPEYLIYNEQGSMRGSFVPTDLSLKIGAAYRIAPKFSAGLDLRYMHSSLAKDVSYSALAADAMIAADFGAAKLAGGFTSLGTPVKSVGGYSFSLPAALTIAGKYALGFDGGHAIDACAQADVFFKGGFRAGAGVEYGYKDQLFARAGFSLGVNSPFPSYFSIGAGAKYYGICFNAAYLLGSAAIGNTVAVGAGLEF